nr:C-type mannose receptor 2-like isoform X1 [Vanessa tameamea]
MAFKTCTSFIFITLFYKVSVFPESKHFRFDYNFHEEAGGWLKLHRIPATWHDAWLRCHLEGAMLASPINIFVETAIRNEMVKNRVTWNGIFSGFHATFSKGDFFSVDGVPLNRVSIEWMPTEPDNKNNDEDCILFAVNGTIADINCNEVHPYMCYKKISKNMIVNGCGTVDKEYSLDPNTGSCYKFHRIARNWTRAFMTCAAEGGHLAVINSETEANVLREIFAKHPQNSIRSNLPGIMRELIHVGFHDWNERGIWTTIHGTPLMEAGFDLWAENQPDNASPGEYCGGMFRNGRLDDVWCHERGPFICEKSPESLLADVDDLD